MTLRAAVGILAVLGVLTSPAIGQEISDIEGARACLALKDALDIFLVSGYVPGLRGRLFSVASQGARSNDAYLRNAMSRLSYRATPTS